MSDRAQRVLDALIECIHYYPVGYPIQTIGHFFEVVNSDDCDDELSGDYESLSLDEEKQVIKKFLEFAY